MRPEAVEPGLLDHLALSLLELALAGRSWRRSFFVKRSRSGMRSSMTYQATRAVSLPVSLPTLGRGQVVVDDPAGVLDHPLQVLAIVLAVAVDVDLADQGEPHRLVGRPGGRVDDVADRGSGRSGCWS